MRRREVTSVCVGGGGGGGGWECVCVCVCVCLHVSGGWGACLCVGVGGGEYESVNRMGGGGYAPYEKDIKQIMTVCTYGILSKVNFEVLSFLKIGFLASQLC